MNIGYARISTNEQNLDLQTDALNKAAVDKIFTEEISGASTLKPQLSAALNIARKGDTLVIWRLDRLGRTTTKLIELVEDLKEKGIHLKSLTENIDTSTSTGNLFFQFMCILAEHERNVIIERTNAGLLAARKRGVKGGRPKGMIKKYTDIMYMVKTAYDSKEYTTTELLKAFDIKSRTTLYKILEAAAVATNNERGKAKKMLL